ALEYRDRFADGRFGMNVKGYIVQTVVDSVPFMFFPPSSILPGGASLNVTLPSQRAGMTFDADVALLHSNRLLFGGEVFRKWQDGQTSTFNSPDPTDSLHRDPLGKQRNVLPFLCPHDSTGHFISMCPVMFVFAASREVAAAFVSDQWRPFQTLVL